MIPSNMRYTSISTDEAIKAVTARLCRRPFTPKAHTATAMAAHAMHAVPLKNSSTHAMIVSSVPAIATAMRRRGVFACSGWLS